MLLDLPTAEAWLNADLGREYLAVGQPNKDMAPEARWGDHGHFDQLQKLALRCAPPGEFAVLPLTD
jgi:hypothetical protein